MRAQDRISEAEFRLALAAPIPDRPHHGSSTGAARGDAGVGLYFEEEVRRQLFDLFGPERVLRGGLRVYSTYDPELQRAAERAIAGRVAQVAKGRRAARDLQGALVAMDPRTGDVLALVGGRDYRASSFNRATQARRQAGSAFKPIVYAAALERGYAPGTLLRDLDVPIATEDEAWLPGGEHELPEYTLRRALKTSSNRAAAQLLQAIGLGTATHLARRLGIVSELPMVPSLALGTGEVTLLELTAAYSAFANRGMASAPRLITRVEDATGTVIWQAPERHVRGVSSTTAYLMSSMLADVVSSGTGATARAHGFRLPAAGKTGTTDDYADAWFIGYTPSLLTGVWFGLDRPAPIMREGYASVVAVPGWAQFMRDATKGARPEWYERPRDVETVAICPRSGARATNACRDAAVMAARAIPAGMSALHTIAAVPDAIGRPPLTEVYEDLFPAGAVPSDACRLHDSLAHTADLPTAAAATAQVDAAVGGAPHARINDALVRLRERSRLFVERVPRPDGSFRLVIRER
jgi:penicillin-binding protein 1A